MHPFKGPTARALKRALHFPRELRAKTRDRAHPSRRRACEPRPMRIFYVDQHLSGHGGHYLNYALALSAAIRSCGRDLTIVANRAMPAGLVAKLKAIPAFTFPPYRGDINHSDFRRLLSEFIYTALRLACNVIPQRKRRKRARALLDVRRVCRTIFADWTMLDRELQFGASDLLILNSMTSIEFLGYIRWMSQQLGTRRPVSISILHLKPGAFGKEIEQVFDRDCWKTAFAEVQRGNFAGKSFFAANSAELANEYGELSSQPISTVTYPITLGLSDRAPVSAGIARTVLFLGAGRVTKGFPLLPDIVQALRSELDAGMIRFIFQLFGSSDADSASALEQLPIELVRGELDPEQYVRLLLSSDILLQPADPRLYSAQISGIFTEARAAGLVTVVPAETLMAREVLCTGGGIVVSEHSAQAYAQGLREAVRGFEQLSAEAYAVACSWRRQHSPMTTIREIDELLPKKHRIAQSAAG